MKLLLLIGAVTSILLAAAAVSGSPVKAWVKITPSPSPKVSPKASPGVSPSVSPTTAPATAPETQFQNGPEKFPQLG